MRFHPSVVARFTLLALIFACSDPGQLTTNTNPDGDGGEIPPPGSTVGSVSFTQNTLTLTVGATTKIAATVKNTAGSVITDKQITWSSSDAAIATVANDGSVSGKKSGHATISASVDGKSASLDATVTDAAVAAVQVQATGTSATPGQTAQATATLRDANDNVLTGRAITWVSSNPGVATVSQSGLITAVAVGSSNINATSEGITGTLAFSVNATPVASVSVSLNASSIQAGATTQATATTRDANNNVLTGRAVTWQSSNTSVATVNASGLVTAVSAGTATITATSEGRSGSASLTVTTASPAPVASVSVSLAASSRNVGQTTQATATLRDASNNVLTGRTITWSSSNTAVATVNGSGVVTAVGAGSANIVATSEGQNGSATLTVTIVPVATVTVTLASSTITVGSTTQATAVLRDANNNVLTGRTITWQSSNTSVATVNSSGLVTAVAAGTANISATSETRIGQATLTSNAPPPPPPTGNGEPVYDASVHSLILRDNFDQYSNLTATLNAYPNNRGSEYMEMTSGRGGSGSAVRLKYGIGAADDIVFGPEARLSRVGGWNGTLPAKAGPYTHFYFTTWFRTSAGANPTQNNSSGIKGFMFWTPSGRYQNAVNQLSADGATRGPKGANPNNAESGMNLYKTADGRAPLWSTYADGNWHRFTIEIYAGGDPSGHWGERYWVDGQLIYSDMDLRVGSGTRPDHYDYALPVTHWMVFGNFINASAASSLFTFDVDDWMAWTQ